MKNPKLERGPKLSNAMPQPQMTINNGVRQVVVERVVAEGVAAEEAGGSLPSVAAMHFLDGWC
jgi:hypothetical protein